jgi:hypothetical protein
VSDVDRDQSAAAPKRFMVQINKPPTTDGFDEVSPVVDMTNFELSPDGSFAMPRRGSAVYRRYALPQPGERMRLLVESQPPNLSDGSELAMIVSSEGIEALKLFKTRTNLPGDTFESKLFFDPDSYTFSPGATVNVIVKRTGALDRQVACPYGMEELYADSGVPIVGSASYADVTFESGEVSKTIGVVTSPDQVLDPHSGDMTYKSYALRLGESEDGTAVPTNGGVIVEPRTANLLPYATFPHALLRVTSGASSGLLDILMWDSSLNQLTGYILEMSADQPIQNCGQCPDGSVWVLNAPDDSAAATLDVYNLNAMQALPAYQNFPTVVTVPATTTLVHTKNGADVSGFFDKNFSDVFNNGLLVAQNSAGKLYIFASYANIVSGAAELILYGFNLVTRALISRVSVTSLPSWIRITQSIYCFGRAASNSSKLAVAYNRRISSSSTVAAIGYVDINTGVFHAGTDLYGGTTWDQSAPGAPDGVTQLQALSDGRFLAVGKVDGGDSRLDLIAADFASTSTVITSATLTKDHQSVFGPGDGIYLYNGSTQTIIKVAADGTITSPFATAINDFTTFLDGNWFATQTATGPVLTDAFKLFSTPNVTLPVTEVYGAEIHDSDFAFLMGKSGVNILNSGNCLG